MISVDFSDHELNHKILIYSRMGKSNGSCAGAKAAAKGYSAPGIIRSTQAASEMSNAWSSGRGVAEVSTNQSLGAKYVNSHGCGQ